MVYKSSSHPTPAWKIETKLVHLRCSKYQQNINNCELSFTSSEQCREFLAGSQHVTIKTTWSSQVGVDIVLPVEDTVKYVIHAEGDALLIASDAQQTVIPISGMANNA